MTSQIIQAISEENAFATEQMLLNFANELKVKTVQNSEVSSVTSQHSPFENSTHSENPSRKLSVDLETEASSSKDKLSTNLSAVSENTPEYIVQSTVRKLMFDSDSPEGNTRRSFVQTFLNNEDQELEDLMLSVRHFIDGMHEYILTERAFSLAMVYQQEKQRLLTMKSVGEEESRVGSENKNSLLMRRASLNFLKQNNIGANQVDETLLIVISYIIFTVVEESIFLSIQEKLVERLRKKKDYVRIRFYSVD
jgi:hypothetical protein